jgi:hypothetical protein
MRFDIGDKFLKRIAFNERENIRDRMKREFPDDLCNWIRAVCSTTIVLIDDSNIYSLQLSPFPNRMRRGDPRLPTIDQTGCVERPETGKLLVASRTQNAVHEAR